MERTGRRFFAFLMAVALLAWASPRSARSEDILWDLFLDYLLEGVYDDGSYGGGYDDGYLDGYLDGLWDSYGGSDAGTTTAGGSGTTGDNDYPIYYDEATGYYFGLYTDDTAYIAGYNGFWSGAASGMIDLTIPASVMGYPVTTIGEEAFADESRLRSAAIPEGVDQIDIGAFARSGLQRVTLPSSLEYIEYNAFLGCASLESVALPSGLLYIGSNAFALCEGLTRVAIPDSVTEIRYDAFYGCARLWEATLGAGLTDMDGNVFSDCPSLSSLTVSPLNRVFVVQDGILYNAVKNSILRYPADRGETAYAIRPGVTEIEDSCFYDTNALTSLTIPESVVAIRDYALSGCVNLRELRIPESVAEIGDYALDGLEGLTIRGAAGSLAERWARAQGYAFAATEAAPTVAVVATPAFTEPSAIAGQPRGMLDTAYLGDSLRFAWQGAPGVSYEYALWLWDEQSPEARLPLLSGAADDPGFTLSAAGIAALKQQMNRWLTVEVTAVSVDGARSGPATASLYLADPFSYSFAKSPLKEDNHLNRESVYAAELVYDFEPHAGNELYDYLVSLGFEDIRSYDFESQLHSVGVVFAHRVVKDERGDDVPLLAVIIRGTHGLQEWISDFDVGAEGNHYGFDQATQRLLTHLQAYAQQMQLPFQLSGTDYKLWIAGHSRGAAVGNLLAGNYLAHNNWNTHAYLYATPFASATHNTDSWNIHNYLIEGDFVPRVPLAVWGFSKQGISTTLTHGRTLYGDPVLTGEQMKGVTGFVGTFVPNRAAYVQYIQPAVDKLTYDNFLEHAEDLLRMAYNIATTSDLQYAINVTAALASFETAWNYENFHIDCAPLDFARSVWPCHNQANYRRLIEERYPGR